MVGDERDLVGVRTNQRQEAVYLYRLNTTPDDARRLLLIYLERINELADRPEYYHLLTNSCTINIVRYANAAGRVGRLDVRHLLNGLIDGYLYYSGRIDTTLSFDELRRRSQINEAAQAADGGPDFSQRIRASLPTMPPLMAFDRCSRRRSWRSAMQAPLCQRDQSHVCIGASHRYGDEMVSQAPAPVFRISMITAVPAVSLRANPGSRCSQFRARASVKNLFHDSL